MDLIDEDDRFDSPSLAQLARLFHQHLDVFDGRARRGERHESGLGGAGDDTGQRGLAGAGRPPEDHRRDAICFDRRTKEPSFAQKIIEADDLPERFRPQPFGEGSLGTVGRVEGGFVEE